MEQAGIKESGHEDELPIVVQVGFAGTRHFVDREKAAFLTSEQSQKIEAEIVKRLADILEKEVVNPIGSEGPAFFCGISQIAVGGDFAFSKACEQIGWVQRIFIPQHQDAYLSASGSEGNDFSEPERSAAEKLLSRDHVIQVRLVSDAHDRHRRFEEANLEISRVSDILIVIMRKDQEPRAGGSNQLLELAKRRGRPALLLTVDVGSDASLDLTSKWLGEPPKKPSLPFSTETKEYPVEQYRGWSDHMGIGPRVPDAHEYISVLKSLGSAYAGWKQRFFKRIALVVLGTHLVATVMALTGLVPVLRRPPISLCHLGFESERTDATQI